MVDMPRVMCRSLMSHQAKTVIAKSFQHAVVPRHGTSTKQMKSAAMSAAPSAAVSMVHYYLVSRVLVS